MDKEKIVVVGLGLIGGSLASALKEKLKGSVEVIGVSRSLIKIHQAEKRKIIDWGTAELEKALAQAKIVFFCGPVEITKVMVKKIDQHARKGTIVSDVGSTKGEIVNWAGRTKFKHIIFVGSHPMAGSHESGLDYADAHLFDHSLVFVTPSRKTDKKALEKIILLWKQLAKKVYVVNAPKHDKIVAQISHLPHVLAALLINITKRSSLKFAASGFRDATRIAQGDPYLWRGIVQSNRKNIEQMLKNFKKEIEVFLKILSKNRGEKILKMLKKASQKRRSLA